jgi:hypothetical protein
MESKTYIVKNKNLALAISYIINQDFYTYDDRFNEGKKVYSFIKTKKFEDVLTLVTNLKKEYGENN